MFTSGGYVGYKVVDGRSWGRYAGPDFLPSSTVYAIHGSVVNVLIASPMHMPLNTKSRNSESRNPNSP